MREILFRGKLPDNGEWVEGLLTIDDFAFANKGVERCHCIKSIPSDLGCAFVWAAVVPETVGQYSGLNDKHGMRIFEGDIIKARIESGAHDGFEWQNMVIGFQEGAFCLLDRNGYLFCALGAFAPRVMLEVIGNIHDNPELLEVEG